MRLDLIIKKLDYSNITLSPLPKYVNLRQWSYDNMPGVVQEMEDLGQDLDEYETWLEVTFLQNIVKFYKKRVAVYLTSSYVDYIHSRRFLNSKVSDNFRNHFDLDCHAVILVHPVISITAEDLDDIYVSLDFDKGWSTLDLSKVDEEDTIDVLYQRDWGWLDADEESESWTVSQTVLAYKRQYFN